MTSVPDYVVIEATFTAMQWINGRAAEKMFGGIGWMLNGNMCVGIYKTWLITRIGEEKPPHCLWPIHRTT